MKEEQQQEKSTLVKYVFGGFPLYEHKTPEFRETKGYEYVMYGDDNTYTDYLVYLYNRSATHNAIVTGKTRFILGRGWQIQDGTQDPKIKDFISRVNPTDDLNDLTYKSILDRLIFGGYALRVVWLGGRIVSVYHQPFQTIRTNVDMTEYFVSSEWTRDQSTKARFKGTSKLPDDVKFYEPFNPNNPQGEQILYITDYRPQLKIYPLPEYVPAIAAIETDIEIDNFHLNNIKSGFAAGTMITLYNGKPADDELKKTEDGFKRKFFGTDNAGQAVLNFAEVNEKEPTISPLRSNELDKQYEQLSKSTVEKIFIGHGVTSPMLFGVKTEGQLGGRNELDLAWQLLNLNYVDPRREQMEADFNYVLQFTGVTGRLELRPLKRLKTEITETLLKENLTKQELRTLIDDSLDLELDLSITPAEPVQMDKQRVDMDAILINKFSQIGSLEMDFISEDEEKLLAYLKGKKTIDIDKATKELKLDVKTLLKRLIEQNIVVGQVTSSGNVEIEKIQEPEVETEVVTMWKYGWNDPKFEGTEDKSRDFCRKLMGLQRLYSKDEIDNLNNGMKDFNTDVWKYRGGWYTIPDTNIHTPQCRHTWKQVLVRRKKK